MSETLNTILARRSTRGFSDRSIPEGEMELIVQAALHVPGEVGFQTQQFTVVRNKGRVQMLTAAVEKMLDRQGCDICRPRVLVIPSNEKESHFDREDDACTMENIFLTAHSLRIGSVWVSQPQGIYDEPAVRQILTSFRVSSGHMVYGMAALGYTINTETDKARTGKAVYVD